MTAVQPLGVPEREGSSGVGRSLGEGSESAGGHSWDGQGSGVESGVADGVGVGVETGDPFVGHREELEAAGQGRFRGV